mmetsp:Transcript_87985/g.246168  ORF Transcript_87985/g.246168 Transcript_87985/m.246168 type:complete len:261 (+) Transcript_87985:240-1022(+)
MHLRMRAGRILPAASNSTTHTAGLRTLQLNQATCNDFANRSDESITTAGPLAHCSRSGERLCPSPHRSCQNQAAQPGPRLQGALSSQRDARARESMGRGGNGRKPRRPCNHAGWHTCTGRRNTADAPRSRPRPRRLCRSAAATPPVAAASPSPPGCTPRARTPRLPRPPCRPAARGCTSRRRAEGPPTCRRHPSARALQFASPRRGALGANSGRPGGRAATGSAPGCSATRRPRGRRRVRRSRRGQGNPPGGLRGPQGGD